MKSSISALQTYGRLLNLMRSLAHGKRQHQSLNRNQNATNVGKNSIFTCGYGVEGWHVLGFWSPLDCSSCSP
jgi:hypothetical protein